MAKGYECIACSSAIEGIDRLKSNAAVDAVLMDMMMPGMDGYEAIPLIRQLDARKHIPIASVTAQAMTGDREKCLASGADMYISKPIDLDQLLGWLKQQ